MESTTKILDLELGNFVNNSMNATYDNEVYTFEKAWDKLVSFCVALLYDIPSIPEDDLTNAQQRAVVLSLLILTFLMFVIIILAICCCFAFCCRRRRVPKYISSHFPLYEAGVNSHPNSPILCGNRRILWMDNHLYAHVLDNDKDQQ